MKGKKIICKVLVFFISLLSVIAGEIRVGEKLKGMPTTTTMANWIR